MEERERDGDRERQTDRGRWGREKERERGEERKREREREAEENDDRAWKRDGSVCSSSLSLGRVHRLGYFVISAGCGNVAVFPAFLPFSRIAGLAMIMTMMTAVIMVMLSA